MERRQLIMMTIGFIGVFGIQVGLYELVKARAPLIIIYGILAIGVVLAFKGFGAYREIEDEQGER